MPHPIELLIKQADTAINQEDFDRLLDIYAEDALLVVKPGLHAVGKAQIRQAFVAIAAHFGHSLQVRQGGMEILETGDTALVLARTLVAAADHPGVERKATYVFRRSAEGAWLCVIDNSYGHDLLDAQV
ncbi:DUF4440 domain-containing protein [Pseudomonas alcaligenes]|uniref:DUF4440 domain-containing protein n=1 Tax=Aquipseudomonas alcaligenes TaxID=43263 RepID=A0ABR7RYI8_AQUAC|nr:SgcJ/EcaC family oxidoreductase [Pseudomonas alcaligenes]MBC9250253.1 DUF4440 domain-containing protein [Pseudomonas alcaligenes]